MSGFGWPIFGLILGWIIFSPNRGPRDSTDTPDNRSGMALYIDAKTGCHYLGDGRGGLIPRLDSNGNHVCVGFEWEPKP